MNIRQALFVSTAAPLLLGGCAQQGSEPVAQLALHPPAAQQISHIPVGPGSSDTYVAQPQPAPGSCRYLHAPNGQALPDPNCTPGAIDPTVRADNLDQTICRHDYAASVSPPATVLDPEKRANAASYGYRGSLRDAEYDHLISLELGGDPNDPRNLWLEPGSARPKDAVERALHTLVCTRQVALTNAQNAIAADWTTALASVGYPNFN